MTVLLRLLYCLKAGSRRATDARTFATHLHKLSHRGQDGALQHVVVTRLLPQLGQVERQGRGMGSNLQHAVKVHSANSSTTNRNIKCNGQFQTVFKIDTPNKRKEWIPSGFVYIALSTCFFSHAVYVLNTCHQYSLAECKGVLYVWPEMIRVPYKRVQVPYLALDPLNQQ